MCNIIEHPSNIEALIKDSILHLNKCLFKYSKFAKDQLFDIAYLSPIANDTPVRVPHYCEL